MNCEDVLPELRAICESYSIPGVCLELVEDVAKTATERGFPDDHERHRQNVTRPVIPLSLEKCEVRLCQKFHQRGGEFYL